jgi:hypothetical protein
MQRGRITAACVDMWEPFTASILKWAALRYLNQWIDQLRWQRLEPFQKLAEMLLRHQEGLLNYCHAPVRSAWWRRLTATSRLCWPP